MNIGILGSGDVAQTLGKAFKSLGNEVMLSSREPESELALELQTDVQIPIKGFDEVAKFAELAVLCTKWEGTENVIKLARAENLQGKTVIDTVNPLEPSENKFPKLAIGHTDSASEQIQRWLPGANVVKAFNIIGSPYMFQPKFQNGPPTMFYCGNDGPSKQMVAQILYDFGWEAVDYGDLTGARELESLAMLWIRYGSISNNWHHAIKLLL